MFFANNSEGFRVGISDAIKGEQYFCPICGGELIVKKGAINIEHFAHKTREEICDGWSYDMSEWHRNWQNRFPKENQEIVVSHNNVKHRADVKIGDTIIEFQHSPISQVEYISRNIFYTKAGFKVVWVFDFIEARENERIEPNIKQGNMYNWSYPKHLFNNYKDNEQVSIFFQLIDDTLKPGYCGIEKVVWVSPDSKRFICGEAYETLEFIELFTKETSISYSDKTSPSIVGVKDTLLQDKSGNYYPCSKNSTLYVNFHNCHFCDYFVGSLNSNSIDKRFKYADDSALHCDHIGYCLYRFKDIIEDWNCDTDRIVEIVRDNEERIEKLVLSKSGIIANIEYNKLPLFGKSIRNLLLENTMNVIGVKNIYTGVRFKIGVKQNRDTPTINGYMGLSNGRGYSKQRIAVYHTDTPDWIIEWEH